MTKQFLRINCFDFPITEVPGQKATSAQLDMFFTRYHFLSQFCKNRDVLEVACGGGQGLGYLARAARKVIGGDIDGRILGLVFTRYNDRPNIMVIKLDAHELPFEAASFDVVTLLDSIYWLSDQSRFIVEAKRVLRPGGVLVVSSVNPKWLEFNPSPYSAHYPDSFELFELIASKGFKAEFYVAFSALPKTEKERIVALVRRVAVNLNIIPGSIRLKQLLKALFLGRLSPVPEEVYEGMARYCEPMKIGPADIDNKYKIMYVVAKLSN